MAGTRVCDLSFDIEDLFETAEATKLTNFEEDFLASLRERFDQYGALTLLSEKQLEVVMRLYEKCG
jgi:hypothetical protein